MIAINVKRSGRLGGVQGADLLCQRDAERSRVEGNFRAFLPSVAHMASVEADRVKAVLSPPFPFMSSNNPISNSRGQILFNSWDQMLETGGLITSGASLYTFDGENIATSRCDI